MCQISIRSLGAVAYSGKQLSCLKVCLLFGSSVTQSKLQAVAEKRALYKLSQLAQLSAVCTAHCLVVCHCLTDDCSAVCVLLMLWYKCQKNFLGVEILKLRGFFSSETSCSKNA